MIISIREAYLGKRPLRPMRNDGWILAVKTGEKSWSEEYRAHKNIQPGDRERFDYTVGMDVYDNPRVSSAAAYRGNSGCDYWYYEFPDGKNVIVICDTRALRDNIDAIKEAVTNQYDGPAWEKSIDSGNDIKLDL